MSAARLSLALAGSLALHLAAAAALLPWLAPRPVPQQSDTPSQVMFDTVQVTRVTAQPRAPESSEAARGDTAGAQLAGQGVAQRRAAAVTARAEPLRGVTAEGARAPALDPPPQRRAALPPEAARLDSAMAETVPAPEPDMPELRQGALTPDAARLESSAATTRMLGAGDITGAVRVPSAPEAERLVAVTQRRAVLPGLASAGPSQPASDPGAVSLSGSPTEGEALADRPVPVQRLAPALSPAARAEAVVARARLVRATATAGGIPAAARPVAQFAAAEVTPPAPVLRPRPPPPPVGGLTPATGMARLSGAGGREIAAAIPEAGRAGVLDSAGGEIAARAPEPGRAGEIDSAGPLLVAGLAWSGAGSVALDSQSLATLQAFLQPGEAAGQDLRDAMARTMAAPDCARVHTVFDADSGTLELRGHVPETQARAPLVASLRAQIGGALDLRDALRILPRPQCALLDAIAGLGLPQSEEQLTDSDLVGENAQVREYAFVQGDRLVIDLTAPDYPAYVYVDYFDASGQVLHLVPNRNTPLRRLAPGAVFSVGRGRDLDLRIAPPFGQDIAVAFAASRPLYDGLRPLVESAPPYLAEMRNLIADARATDPGFRGEWVYLFVATSAALR